MRFNVGDEVHYANGVSFGDGSRTKMIVGMSKDFYYFAGGGFASFDTAHDPEGSWRLEVVTPEVVVSSEAGEVQIGGTHYNDMPVQPWDVVDSWPLEQQVGAHRKDVLKYLMRAGNKGSALEDYQKAAHVLNKLIEVLESSE